MLTKTLRTVLCTVCTTILLSIHFSAFSATWYSIASGAWNSTSTWSATPGGSSGTSVPIAGDQVIIEDGHTINVTANAAAASMSFSGASATLSIDAGATLSISGSVNLAHNASNSTACLLTGLGTLNCASLTVGSNLLLNGNYSAIFTSTIANLNVSGDVLLTAKDNGSFYGQSALRIEDGTTKVGGQITSSLPTGCTASLSMNGATTGSQTGTLTLTGINPWGTLTGVTLSLNGTSATIEYKSSSTQSILGTTYTNLKVNTVGLATLAGNATVNGIFYMTQGSFALGGKTLTWGSSASLTYNGTAAQTTGTEWPASFNRPVTIANTSNIVTIGGSAFTGTSATTTINTGATLATGSGTFTAAGPMAINGAFQINGGGWATGNTWTYANGTLIFNNTTGSYGVNNGDVFWPTTNGPSNINVKGAGGITLNSGTNRTVSGLFQTSAGVTITGSLTINGTCQINAGGYFNQSPSYGNASTLVYNTGNIYNRYNEWTTATSGAGYPNNIQISNPGTNTTLNIGSTTAKCSGNITVDAAATLNTTSSGLTILGNVTANGTISLSGDVYVAGNWTVGASGSQLNNSKAVFFNAATGNQTITKTGGGIVYFDYLIINKLTSGNVVLSSSPATDVVINSTTGQVLQFLNGGLDLNSRSLTLNNDGGTIQVTGGARNVTSTTATGFFNIQGAKTVNSSSSGSLVLASSVTLKNTGANVDLGLGLTTINGTFELSGGYLKVGGAPIYGSTSLLKYNTGNNYVAAEEWYANTSGTGAGVPQNVTIAPGSSLSFTGAYFRLLRGDFNFSTPAPATSTFSLSATAGGDLRIGGNWNRGIGGIFTCNGRLVSFNGSTNQTISAPTAETFDYLEVNNNAGISLSDNVVVNNNLMLTNGLINTGSYTITLAAAATISSASATSYVNGKMARIYAAAGSKDFAIGKGGYYRPITLNYTALTGTSTVTAEQIEGLMPGTAPASITKFTARYWTISQSGGTNFSYKVTLNGTGFTPIGTPVMLTGDGVTITSNQVTTPNYTNSTALTSFGSEYGLGENSNANVFNVTGTGSYCQGNAGLPVGLDGSESGVTYTLYQDNVAQATTIAGTGSAISFGNQPGTYTYTVKGAILNGTPIAMNGSAVITLDPLPAAAGSIVGTASVCQGESNVTYSVPLITDAITYTWHYSGTGATINNGTSNNITISFANNATSGDLTVMGTNSCGNGTSSTAFAISVSSFPAPAGTISGTASVCPGMNGISYSVPSIAIATSYTWIYSGSGASIINGNTNNITVNFASNATTGNLTVFGINSCGNGSISAEFPITFNGVPSAAGLISGSGAVCPGELSVQYSVPTIPNASSYIWSYSGTGATLDNLHQNTLTIDFAANATSGNLSVMGVNSCGNGTSSGNFPITVNSVPAAAGTITGDQIAFQGQVNVTYSVPEIANATSYIWQLPDGFIGSSNTNSIILSLTNNAVSGSISVKGHNACGDGTSSSLFVNVYKHAQIKLFLEGLFNPETSLMNPSQDENGNHFNTNVADQVELSLHSSVAPYETVLQLPSVDLMTNGSCGFYVSTSLSSSYYISVSHRNHLETWSSSPISFSVSPVSFDFSNSVANAYGDNQKLIAAGIYGLYAGDVDNNGKIDYFDIIGINSDAVNFLGGYVKTDVNGDGVVDSNDLIITDNNTTKFISLKKPN